jgi:hypothetical protein
VSLVRRCARRELVAAVPVAVRVTERRCLGLSASACGRGRVLTHTEPGGGSGGGRG